MEELPEALALEILSRLDDSADVARCQLAWKTFNSVSPELRSINLQWRLNMHLESRSRVSNSSTSSSSPLKTIFLNLLSKLKVVESVRIGVENVPLDMLKSDGEARANDLHLTDEDFILQWLPRVSGTLKSLSISGISARSRRSNVLSLVSANCHNLFELEVKKACLSVNSLNQMLMLTSLKLEAVQLDDEELIQLNKCFPNLQVLNLIRVFGLRLPTIRLPNLKTCHCSLYDRSPYLSVIAPKLITLALNVNGVSPDTVDIQAPMLSHFHLYIHYKSSFIAKNLENLKTLWLETSYIRPLLVHIRFLKTVKNLTLNSGNWAMEPQRNFTLGQLFNVFPNVTSLCFKSRVWSEFEAKRSPFAWVPGGRIETFCGYLLMKDISLTLSSVACVLDECSNLVEVSLLIYHDVASSVMKDFIGTCMGRWPELNWKWGTWEEGKEDSWITDVGSLSFDT